MNIKIKTLLTVFGFIVYQSQAFSQKPNYTGTWILNIEKSQLQANWAKGITKGVFTITQVGDKFTLSRYFIIKGKKRKLRFKMIADGKTRRKKILFKGKLEWKENNLQATIFRNGFLNVVDYRLGNNQNELIADEVFTGRPQDYHNHWVFERENSK
jgi:hypothetical protein